MWNRKLKQASQPLRGSCTWKTEDSCADFISELPDHLLLHIFSFLDKTVVFQSSVLSSRWRYLWTLVPFPTAFKEMRSYFKEKKASFRKEKLSQEEKAKNTISEFNTTVAHYTVQSFFGFLLLAKVDFIVFVVFSPLITLWFMLLMCSSFSLHHTRLCFIEGCLKRLRMRDAILTSNANSHSTTKILELLFPENYEPRYAKLAKVYGLIGILLMIMIPCSLFVLKSKFDLSHGIGASVVDNVLGLVSSGVGAFYLLKIKRCCLVSSGVGAFYLLKK